MMLCLLQHNLLRCWTCLCIALLCFIWRHQAHYHSHFVPGVIKNVTPKIFHNKLYRTMFSSFSWFTGWCFLFTSNWRARTYKTHIRNNVQISHCYCRYYALNILAKADITRWSEWKLWERTYTVESRFCLNLNKYII